MCLSNSARHNGELILIPRNGGGVLVGPRRFGFSEFRLAGTFSLSPTLLTSKKIINIFLTISERSSEMELGFRKLSSLIGSRER